MLKKLKTKDIRPNPFQPRKTVDTESIALLAEEIKKVGLWAGALRGRENNGHVELCFGHRRLAAVKKLGWKEVDVDVVNLTDEEMALQSLVENLQREGLNDADKGDAFAAYIKLRIESKTVERSTVYDELSESTGYSRERIRDFLEVAGLSEVARQTVESGALPGATALEANRIGGEEFVKVAADKEMSVRTVRDIGKKLREITNPKTREKVRKKVIKGEIESPKEVDREAMVQDFMANRKDAPDNARLPPDLVDLIREWTERIIQWTGELDQALPFKGYIERSPTASKRWKESVLALISRLEKFVE